MENGCEAGCKMYTGGEIKHHQDCQHYTQSMSKLHDDIQNEVEKLHCHQLLKIMKRKLNRTALIAIAIIALSYGFTEGMEWHRLASVIIGGLCIGTAIKI